MKGFIAAVTIFSLVISGLFLYENHMNTTFDPLFSTLDSIEKSIMEGDFESAFSEAENFDESLKSKTRQLYFFTDRSPIDEAVNESSKLKSFIKSKDDAEAISVLSGIKSMLLKISEKADLKIYNIL